MGFSTMLALSMLSEVLSRSECQKCRHAAVFYIGGSYPIHIHPLQRSSILITPINHFLVFCVS